MPRGLKNLSLVLAITLVLILATEGILYLGWIATKSTKLGTLYSNSIHWQKDRLINHHYPDKPGQYLKIATFGGSSTEGAIAERNFANVLEYEFAKWSDKPVYVRNYGRSGNAFHRDQAEIAKIVAPHYDILVVYAGHNEWTNPYYDNGGFPRLNIIESTTAQHLEKKRAHFRESVLADIQKRWGFSQAFHDYSRIYAILYKLSIKMGVFDKIAALSDPVRGGAFGSASPKRPRLTELEKLFPETTIAKIGEDFEASLESLVLKTKQHGAQLVVVPPVGNELWPPYFSAGTPDDTVDALLRKSEQLLRSGRLDEAAVLASPILDESPRHAFANYVRGMADLAAGRVTAWNYLGAAVDEDPFPHRALGVIDRVARATKTRHPEIVYAEFPATVRRLINEGARQNLLFADWVHPSLFGHVLIARMTLCGLSAKLAFSYLIAGQYCNQITPASARELDAAYRRDFGVTAEESLQQLEKIFKWAVLLARISAHPAWFYTEAERYLPNVYGNPASGKIALGKNSFWAAVLSALRGEDCALVEDRIKSAKAAEVSIYEDMKRSPFPGYPPPSEILVSACPNLTL